MSKRMPKTGTVRSIHESPIHPLWITLLVAACCNLSGDGLDVGPVDSDSDPADTQQPTGGGGTWAQGCDIRIRDAGGDRDGVNVVYQEGGSGNSVTVTINSTQDIDLDHSSLPGPVALAKNTSYTISITNIIKNQTAQIAITPGILPTPTDFDTHGAQANTDGSGARVYTTPYDDDSILLWISKKRRSTPFWLQVQDTDVVIQDQVASSKHVLEVDYLANTTAEWLNVEVRSNKDAMLHHPYLASEVLLNANQTYTLTLSNVNSGQSAQLAITPGVIPSPVDIATWGAHKNTANGAVQAIPHDDDTVALWMYLNGRSAAVHLSDPNP